MDCFENWNLDIFACLIKNILQQVYNYITNILCIESIIRCITHILQSAAWFIGASLRMVSLYRFSIIGTTVKW